MLIVHVDPIAGAIPGVLIIPALCVPAAQVPPIARLGKTSINSPPSDKALIARARLRASSPLTGNTYSV
jgi:hypothetical protein